MCRYNQFLSTHLEYMSIRSTYPENNFYLGLVSSLPNLLHIEL